MPLVTFVAISPVALEKASPGLIKYIQTYAVLRHWWLDEAKYVFQEVAGLPGSCMKKGALPRLSSGDPLYAELQKLKKEAFTFEASICIEHHRRFFKSDAGEGND